MNGKRFVATLSGLALVLAMGSPALAAGEKAQFTYLLHFSAFSRDPT